MQADHVRMVEASTTSEAYQPMRKSAYVRYVRLLLALPLLCAAGALVAIRYLPSCSPLEGSAGYVIDYRYQMKHVDADVLIYGDSSATRNLDPIVIGHDLQMKVANIGGDAQSFRVLRITPIDFYLKYNKAPRVIILAAAPWDLVPGSLSADNSFDGIMMIVRHSPLLDVARLVIGHPVLMSNFLLQAEERMTNFSEWVQVGRWRNIDKRLYAEMEEHSGFVPQGFASANKSPLDALGQECAFNLPQVDPVSKGSIATEFVSRFSTAQTKTLVYLSALPNCTHYELYTNNMPRQDWLIPSRIVPRDYMVNDTSFIHSRMTHTATLSHIASTAIGDRIKDRDN